MENNTSVYVCFVQDVSAFSSEEVVSFLMVTQNRDKVKEWLDEQISEANENGYVLDEGEEDVTALEDFLVTVSKGNDTDGYESYSMVCRKRNIE